MTKARLQTQYADPEFQTWSLLHARDNRLHGAELAQVTQHHRADSKSGTGSLAGAVSMG